MREMKDSGIEWIGEIPKHWKCCKVKNSTSFVGSGTTPTSSNQDFYDGDINWIQSGDLYKTVVVDTVEKKLTEKALKSFSALHIYQAPFIVMAMYGASVGNTAFSKIDACCNQACCCIKNNEFFDLKFMYYWLDFAQIDFLGRAIGGTQPNISQDKIKNQYIVKPSLEEQQRITDFLDTQCSEIDATAEDIQKEISLLEDYKKSVITEAVTKGLNPDAEMKDSGVEWLPKIPKHWKVIPSKYLFANSDIRRQTGDEQLTASQKYGIITQKDYTAKENAQIVLATQGLEKWKHVEPNDFIISLRSFQGGLEMSEITGCITWHYVVLKAQKEVCHKYYKWLFKSARYINALQGTCNFIRDGQDLRFSNFALVPLFELPLEEQQQIADYLDIKCSEIDTLIADKKRQLDILADYKKSIIYEYVTGKKEVPVNE